MLRFILRRIAFAAFGVTVAAGAMIGADKLESDLREQSQDAQELQSIIRDRNASAMGLTYASRALASHLNEIASADIPLMDPSAYRIQHVFRERGNARLDSWMHATRRGEEAGLPGLTENEAAIRTAATRWTEALNRIDGLLLSEMGEDQTVPRKEASEEAVRLLTSIAPIIHETVASDLTQNSFGVGGADRVYGSVVMNAFEWFATIMLAIIVGFLAHALWGIGMQVGIHYAKAELSRSGRISNSYLLRGALSRTLAAVTSVGLIYIVADMDLREDREDGTSNVRSELMVFEHSHDLTRSLEDRFSRIAASLQNGSTSIPDTGSVETEVRSAMERLHALSRLASRFPGQQAWANGYLNQVEQDALQAIGLVHRIEIEENQSDNQTSLPGMHREAQRMFSSVQKSLGAYALEQERGLTERNKRLNNLSSKYEEASARWKDIALWLLLFAVSLTTFFSIIMCVKTKHQVGR
jgi:hypothetical protein